MYWYSEALMVVVVGDDIENMFSPYTLLSNSSNKEQKYLAFYNHSAKLSKNTDTSYWENWK